MAEKIFHDQSPRKFGAGIELSTHGSAIRHISVVRHVSDCAMRPCDNILKNNNVSF